MQLHRKFGYTESLDYSILPEFVKLSSNNKQLVFETYGNAFRSTIHLGQKIALGKAHESAKILIGNLTQVSQIRQEVPKSIFDF